MKKGIITIMHYHIRNNFLFIIGLMSVISSVNAMEDNFNNNRYGSQRPSYQQQNYEYQQPMPQNNMVVQMSLHDTLTMEKIDLASRLKGFGSSCALRTPKESCPSGQYCSRHNPSAPAEKRIMEERLRLITQQLKNH
jgi:hypothetical protein